MIDTSGFTQLEQQNGLPSGTLNAVMQQESGGNPNAVSPVGAMGAFQFMPATARQYGINPNDPTQAAPAAATMLGQLVQKYNGSLPHALAGYNWGQGNVDRQGLQNAPPETQNYIQNVMSHISNAAIPAAQASDFQPATFDVQMPDGTTIKDVPQGTTQSQLQQKLASYTQQQPQGEPGFFSRVGTDLQNRNQMVADATGRYTSDQQSLPETLLQATGKGVAGSVNDIIGEGAKSAINYTPDFIKQPIVDIGRGLADSDIGRGAISLAKQGSQAYGNFASNNPRAAADLESVGDIATALPLTKAAGKGSSLIGTGLTKTGDALVDMAGNQTANAKNAFVKDLVTPKQTASIGADQFSRSTEQGLLRNRVIQPTPQELDMINTVAQLPVSDNKSLLANYNIISDANKAEAQSLIGQLKTSDVPISDDTIINSLSDIRKNLSVSPYITGDGSKAADKVMNIALNKITSNPQTASGLLQARKDFDAEIMRFKGSNVFDPNLDNPVTEAVRQIRQGINNMVASSTPNVKVRSSLQKQSNMYKAMDNIETKGASEGSNIIKRSMQKVAGVIPVKGAIAKTALALGATGLAAAAPALALGTGAIYGGAKAANSAFLKRNVGRTLNTAGRLMGGK